jgi:cyclase
LRRGGLVKTRRFKDAKYVGDPINAIRIFNEKEVDELMVLDIVASKEGMEPDYRMIGQFAGECFMPLCYGGGIRTLDQAKRVFDLGVEKVCLQSAVIDSPSIITEISGVFGSQSVVISIDIKRDWFHRPRLYESRSGRTLGRDWRGFLRAAVDAGAGEAVLNAVDRDGVMSGYDLELVRQAAETVSVPLIALGGAGTFDHLRQAVNSGASAVAAGAMFVFQGPHRAVLISYPPYAELEKLFQERM